MRSRQSRLLSACMEPPAELPMQLERSAELSMQVERTSGRAGALPAAYKETVH